MRNLEKIFYECIRECVNVNIPIRYNDIISLDTTNKYLKFCFGVCGKEYNEEKDKLEFIISIHPKLLEDNCPMKELKEVIIHELIHTCNRCWGHGKTWMKYANILDEKYGYELVIAKSEIDIFYKEMPILHHYICPKCSCRYNARFEEIPKDFRCIFCGTKYNLID